MENNHIKNTGATKQNIYETAKRLFYYQGYKATTIEQIAREAGVPKGSVTYYFKKEDIYSCLYLDFFNAIFKRIDETVGDKIENKFQRHIILVRIYFNVIFDDPHSKALYREILMDQEVSLSPKVHEAVRAPLIEYAKMYDLKLGQTMLERIMEAELGARNLMIRARFDYLQPRISASFIDFTSSIAVRLMGVSPDVIEADCEKAEKLLAEIDYSDIRFIDFEGK